MPVLRLLDERASVGPTCGLREPAFFCARTLLGDLAIRNFCDFPPSFVIYGRSQSRRTGWVSRHFETTDNPLRSSFRYFFSILDGLSSAPNRRAATSRMASARALLSAATAFRDRAQIH